MDNSETNRVIDIRTLPQDGNTEKWAREKGEDFVAHCKELVAGLPEVCEVEKIISEIKRFEAIEADTQTQIEGMDRAKTARQADLDAAIVSGDFAAVRSHTDADAEAEADRRALASVQDRLSTVVLPGLRTDLIQARKRAAEAMRAAIRPMHANLVRVCHLLIGAAVDLDTAIGAELRGFFRAKAREEHGLPGLTPRRIDSDATTREFLRKEIRQHLAG